MSPRRVFVTGASGYIAGRWIERHGSGRQVIGLTRDPRKAAQLYRYSEEDVRVWVADVRDVPALAEGMTGCDAVIHAAFGIDGDESNCRSVTLGGTQAALEAARQARVRRFVFLSSWVVYDLGYAGPINEASTWDPHPTHYARAKQDAEQFAREFCRNHGIGLVILEPTMVYGPRSSIFTTPYLEALHYGDLVLIDDGHRPANLVHVDDVARAVECGLRTSKASGERYLISHPERTTWRQLLEGYQEMWGSPCLVSRSLAEIQRERRFSDRLRGLARSAPETWRALRSDPELARGLYRLPLPQALKRFSPGLLRWLQSAYRRRPKAVPAAPMAGGPTSVASPKRKPAEVTSAQILAQSREAVVCPDAALQDLGWIPEFDLSRSLADIERWARHVGLIRPWGSSAPLLIT